MTQRSRAGEPTLSRRAMLAGTGGMLTGAVAFGLVGQAEAQKRHRNRGGTLRFATRSDVTGLDQHRHLLYLVSMPLAAISQGLLDIDQRSEPVPGVASEWHASKDLTTYTFKLRSGVLFHNGREIDAAAVKWNFDRIRDPKIAHPLTRSAAENIKDVIVADKHTVRFVLEEPSAAFPADVVYYPCGLMAPDSVEQADLVPVGCGPFKFVKWDRNETTALVRFENYFETDAEGNSLPYLDSLIGRPKKEDRVRLTALRAAEVDLIDNMSYADAAEFPKKYAGQFQTWEVPTLATSFITFNLEQGPFTDKRVRQAAAHAIDHEAIRQAVFYGRGETAQGYYAPASPWHTAGVKPWPEYDPDKARFLLRAAHAVGAEVALQAEDAWPYMQQTADLLQAMWTEVGFKVANYIYDRTVLLQKRRSGDFYADSMAASYRWDPDGFYARQILSSGATTKIESRFHHEQADNLILEARRTADRQKRLEMYATVDSIINEELPLLYIHHLTLLEAGTLQLHGYQPAVSGAFSIRGGGIRTAWIAS